MRLRAFLQIPLLAAVLLAPALISGQPNNKVTTKTWTPPRTADGQPDLQGLWTNSTITPFERPKDLAGKEFFTPEEAAAYEKKVAANANRDRRGDTAEADVAGAYNDFWFERGSKVVPTRRTSLVIDPPDGRVPALTPEAQKAAAVLGRNYPETFWYKQSLRLLGRENKQVDRRTASRK